MLLGFLKDGYARSRGMANKPEMTRVKICGRAVNISRDQVSFSDSGLEYRFSGTVIPGIPWIRPISDIKRKIEKKIAEQFNFWILNRYKNGTHGIGQHSDDETQLSSDAPIIAVSLGEERKMVFENKESRSGKGKQSITIPLHNGGVLVMDPPTNRFWTHGMPKENLQINFLYFYYNINFVSSISSLPLQCSKSTTAIYVWINIDPSS